MVVLLDIGPEYSDSSHLEIINTLNKLDQIYNKIDYMEFENRYDELKLNYINFLKKNGLEYRDSI